MTLSLKGLEIALSGNFGKVHGELAKLIRENGGTHTTKITDNCTHLVATRKDFESQKAKVEQAKADPEIHIVSYEWLSGCFDSPTKLDEASFAFAMGGSYVPHQAVPGSQGKKRALTSESESEDEAPPPKKQQKDGQKAKSSSFRVPLDDYAMETLGDSYRVYIAADGTIYDALLNMSNAQNNNNKFYRIQLLVSTNNSYHTWTRWGRVGDGGQMKVLGNGMLDEAIEEYNKKFKDKSGLTWKNRMSPPKNNKYTFLERKYDNADPESDKSSAPDLRKRTKGPESLQKIESKLSKAVQRLLELIFNRQYFANTMQEMSYDAERLPLKDLSKRVLERGYQILKDISELLISPELADEKHNMTFTDAIAELSNAFYSTIPHNFGRSRAPTISSNEKLLVEAKVLESLSDMEIAGKIMQESTGTDGSVHTLDRHLAGLNLDEMTPLAGGTEEYTELERYLLQSHGATHGMKFKVQDIFRVKRQGEEGRFNSSPFASLVKKGKSDRRLLWHGSRCTNFGGILSQGLRIAPPEAPANGYAFGKGVYLADISSKSAGYCFPEDTGDTGLILLCEAELGHPKLERLIGFDVPDYPQLAKSKGCASTFGKGATSPIAWKDASCVHPSLEGVQMPDMDMGLARRTDGTYHLLYNEYIVYDISQIKLRYLLRVKME